MQNTVSMSIHVDTTNDEATASYCGEVYFAVQATTHFGHGIYFHMYTLSDAGILGVIDDAHYPTFSQAIDALFNVATKYAVGELRGRLF